MVEKLLCSREQIARKRGVVMGHDNFIASDFWSSEPYLIKVGSHCAITSGVKFFTHGGGRIARSKYPKFDCFGRVEIGDYVYIGTNSLICQGVRIGNNVLVAAGSVVTKSVPDGMVVGGNPARIIGTIDEYIGRNSKYNLNSKGMSPEDKKSLLLSLPEDKLIRKREMRREK